MVAAGHRLSARAGAQALAAGGGAADAVCAAAFAGAVAESPLTGPAAGGFLMVRSPAGETALLDFFVAVPGLGPGGRRLDPGDLDSFTVPFGGAEQVFHIGPASVAVPGMIAGLGEAVRRFGRMSLAEVVAPAVALAREGVVLTRETAYLHQILAEMLTFTPATAAIYAPGGRLLGEGERVRFPDLAATLHHLGEAGASSMRDGALARAITDHLSTAGGLVTPTDLREYRVIERVPLSVRYRDVTLLINPPPSSGGALIAAALRDIEAGPPAADAIAHYRAVARAGAAANALRDEAFPDDLHQEDCMERIWSRWADNGGRSTASRLAQAHRIDHPCQRGGCGRRHGEPLRLQRIELGGGGAGHRDHAQQHAGRGGSEPGGLRSGPGGCPDDLDDGAGADAARRRAGPGARLGGLQPPSLGHPPDRGRYR